MGILAAVEYWSRADHRCFEQGVAEPGGTNPEVGGHGARCHDQHLTPDDGNSYPTLSVMWDEAKFGLTIAQCAQAVERWGPAD